MRVALVCPGDSLHTQPWVDELMSRGHDVLVYAYPPHTHDFGDAHVIEVQGKGPLGRASWLRDRIRHDAPELLTMHYAGTDMFALSMMGLPLIVSAWGSDILRDITGPLKRRLVATGLRRAALVISAAEHMSDKIASLGVDRERIFTRQYGVDTEYFSPRDAVAEPAGPPVRVVCTRAMRPVYGNEDIIRALALVDVRMVREVVFTGRGPLFNELQSLAADLGVSDRTRFLGGVESMPDALRAGDIYCSMSRSDGLSLSLLEAMSCGLPVVVSDIPANREWVHEGENGHLVACDDPQALADRLTALAGDVAHRRAIGQVARETVLRCGDKRVNVPAIIDAVENAVKTT